MNPSSTDNDLQMLLGTGSPEDETNVTCHCRRCFSESEPKTFPSRMFLCSECGNKRCPHATDHRLECTNSNEPGQPGSDYE